MFKSKFVKRLLLPLAIVGAMAVTVYAIINAFSDNLTFFYTPTQLAQGEAPNDRSIRLGGMVERGSMQREAGTLNVSFRVTDMKNKITVTYTGITPDLFKEGKGVVAEGMMKNGTFVAHEILAKHDENYMPPVLKK
ncbi:MAG: cytochrome c maturation protein CcmE [Methylophilaceae bacterium]